MPALAISELTGATVQGTGVFDVLMRANKAHLEQEFKESRIKGPEYATVYLGSLESVMQTALAFLLQQRKNDLEAQLLEKQIALATQQAANLVKEGEILDKQKLKMDAEVLLAQKQVEKITQDIANAIIEGTVLVAQECKLRAEFDVLMQTKLKTVEETALLTQKVATERAQVTALGVDENSVVGKQKALYGAQTDGFKRDAEQKAAKLLVDTWSVRRTTDEGTVADGVNKLNDATIGRVIEKVLVGVNA